MKLLLVRHLQPAIAPGICYGRLDVPLAGDAPLAALAARLRATGIARVWTSPARRCRILAEAVGDPVVDPRLQELDFGAWEGRPWDAIDRAALDAWAADPLHFAPPGGESAASLLHRLESVAADLREDAILVTHGGPLRLLPALLAGCAPDLAAPAPPFGAVVECHVTSADSAAHSLTTAHAPNTSPVNPPI